MKQKEISLIESYEIFVFKTSSLKNSRFQKRRSQKRKQNNLHFCNPNERTIGNYFLTYTLHLESVHAVTSRQVGNTKHLSPSFPKFARYFAWMKEEPWCSSISIVEYASGPNPRISRRYPALCWWPRRCYIIERASFAALFQRKSDRPDALSLLPLVVWQLFFFPLLF